MDVKRRCGILGAPPAVPLRGLMLVVAAVLVAACSGGQGGTDSGASGSPEGHQEAVGIVIDIKSTSPADVSGFTLRTSSGEMLVLEIDQGDPPAGDFPPAHLREHMAAAEPVRVVYEPGPDTLLARELFDAPQAERPRGGSTASPARGASAPSPTPLRGSPTQTTGNAGGDAFQPDQIQLELVDFVDGLQAPLFLTHAGDGTGQLYVLEQAGRIRLIAADGTLQEEPFLDITERVSSGGERGLLGLAFHPAYESNGRFFVNYTDRNGDTHISEFARSSNGAADPGSERVLLAIEQPFPNHNGGMIDFGPDGYLYIGMGDGGGAGDPHDNGQRLDTLLGKMLRIDVDVEGDEAYGVPDDNPYAGRQDARPEIWATGLRNPWRWSFDRQTGDMFIGDVGQAAREEISVGRAGEGGRNYGWRIMEGDRCFEPEQCDPTGLVQPAVSYPREQGSIVIGGYVYRGSAYPELRGGYLFADLAAARIWGFRASDALAGRRVDHRELAEAEGLAIASFGEDESGELYVLDLMGSVKKVATR